MTLLLGILLLGGYFLLQGLVMGLALLPDLVAGAKDGGTADLMTLLRARLGLLFTIATAVAAPLTIGSTLAVARWGLARQRVAEPTAALRRSLGIIRPRFSQVAAWAVATVVLLVLYEWLARWLDRPPLPDFMAEFHASSGWLPGLLFVVVFVAPLVEEVVFRGFLLPGLAAARGGATGAIAVTALLFALVHTQYDLFDMSAVLALGVLLGAARHASGSLWLAYGLHAAINAVAAAQLVWALGW
jgi:membrane protease YdiL (CAAX protease family)